MLFRICRFHTACLKTGCHPLFYVPYPALPGSVVPYPAAPFWKPALKDNPLLPGRLLSLHRKIRHMQWRSRKPLSFFSAAAFRSSPAHSSRPCGYLQTPRPALFLQIPGFPPDRPAQSRRPGNHFPPSQWSFPSGTGSAPRHLQTWSYTWISSRGTVMHTFVYWFSTLSIFISALSP